MIPQRHQRKRTKGYRLPDGVVCVTRPGKWGNPYPTAAEFECIFERLWSSVHHSHALPEMDASRNKVLKMIQCLEQLRGKDLACFCKVGDPCHADVLIQFANR